MALTNLYGTYLQDTYDRITQVSKSNASPDKWVLADGLGNSVTWLNVTASYATTASYIEGIGNAGGTEYNIQFNSGSKLSGSVNFTYDYNTNTTKLTGSADVLGTSTITITGSDPGMTIKGVAVNVGVQVVPFLARATAATYVPSGSLGQIWTGFSNGTAIHIYDVTGSAGDLLFRGRLGVTSSVAGPFGNRLKYAANLDRVLAPSGMGYGNYLGKLFAFNPATIGSISRPFYYAQDLNGPTVSDLSIIDYSCSYVGADASGIASSFGRDIDPASTISNLIYSPSASVHYYSVFGYITASNGKSGFTDISGLNAGSALSASISSLSASNSEISGAAKYFPVGYYRSTFDAYTPSNTQTIDLTPQLTGSFGLQLNKLFSGSFLGTVGTFTGAVTIAGAYNTNLKRMYCVISPINNSNKLIMVELDDTTSVPTVVAVNSSSIYAAPGYAAYFSIEYSANTNLVLVKSVNAGFVNTVDIFDASSTVNWASPIFSDATGKYGYYKFLPISNSYYTTGYDTAIGYPYQQLPSYVSKFESGSGGITYTSYSLGDTYNFYDAYPAGFGSLTYAASVNSFYSFDASNLASSGSSIIGTYTTASASYVHKMNTAYAINTSSLAITYTFNPYGIDPTNGPNNLAEYRDATGSLLSYIDPNGVFRGTASYALSSSGSTGGTGTPGGATTQVQFNDAGSFGGDIAFTYDKTNDILHLTGALALGTIAAPTPAPGMIYFDGTNYYLGFP